MPEITLTPLIDTALTLLVIFMITAPMVQNAIKVDLPHGKSKEAEGTKDLVVAITKDNKIYFNSYPVDKDHLGAAVQKELMSKPDTPVYVEADETLAYGNVAGVVDELKFAGITYVAMSTRRS